MAHLLSGLGPILQTHFEWDCDMDKESQSVLYEGRDYSKMP